VPKRSLPLAEGPYTLAGAAEPVVPQVIPTYSIASAYSIAPANVPALFHMHFVPKRSAMWPQLAAKMADFDGTFSGSRELEKILNIH
jgi:hypothetical protein